MDVLKLLLLEPLDLALLVPELLLFLFIEGLLKVQSHLEVVDLRVKSFVLLLNLSCLRLFQRGNSLSLKPLLGRQLVVNFHLFNLLLQLLNSILQITPVLGQLFNFFFFGLELVCAGLKGSFVEVLILLNLLF